MKTDHYLYGKSKEDFMDKFDLTCFQSLKRTIIRRLNEHIEELEAKRPLDIKQQKADVIQAIKFWEEL